MVLPFTEIGKTREEANLKEMDTCIWSPEERPSLGTASLYIWYLNASDMLQIVLQLKCYKEKSKNRGEEIIYYFKEEESEK